MFYPLARTALFALDPEVAHHVALHSLKKLQRLQLAGLIGSRVSAPREVMGLKFDNPVGLAAGLDKNGEYIDALAAMGFGSIEVGTVTPRPQPGNPRPRMFRLKEHEALITDMVRASHTFQSGIEGSETYNLQAGHLDNANSDGESSGNLVSIKLSK